MAVLERSELIATLEEARAYYVARMVGSHPVTVHGQTRTILFERKLTHHYSEEPDDPSSVLPRDKVVRYLPGRRIEIRRFSLDRARLLDQILPALRAVTYALPGTGQRGQGNRLVHGPRLPDGRYMRVVLSPWQGQPGKYTCVTAYPISEAAWLRDKRTKPAPFP